MDEYYCPNCGATLNDQPGFDPDGGTWTCTACGKLLMDDDVYDGDTYEGVAWFCDECGARLLDDPGHAHEPSIDPRWAALSLLVSEDAPEKPQQTDTES